MKVDYIVVGFGLAGLAFTEQLRMNGKSVVVIDKVKESSSRVAGGMYNPVILKRFTLPWCSEEQLDYAIPFYKEIESYLQNKFLIANLVLRIFSSVEEQNGWSIAADRPGLTRFLNTRFQSLEGSFISNPFKLGEVKESGRLRVGKLLAAYAAKLESNYIKDNFNHDELQIDDTGVSYKSIEAKHIVFTEGYGMKKNPYFKELPLLGTKGETLTIFAPELKLKNIIKSGVFIIPQDQEGYYLVGATYNWTDKSWCNTTQAKEELVSKLNAIVNCSYEFVEQTAGIRPTVKDRRPLVGRHHKFTNMYLLNGLGTRGVMVAPLLSEQLFNFIESGTDLNPEVSISRFYQKKQKD